MQMQRASYLVFFAASCLAAPGCRDAASLAGPPGNPANEDSAAPTADIAKQSDQPTATANLEKAKESPQEVSETSILETSFDDIKFEMEKTDPFVRRMLTAAIEKLFDRRIRIRGYMLPSFQQRGLREFVLVRDNLECCFGPGAALYDCILVKMNAGKTADFSIRSVTVQGTFRFSEFKDPVNGSHLAIYQLDGEFVE